MDKFSLGIDIGGSHISCQLFNLKTNHLVEGSKIRTEVDGNGSKESILQCWIEAIQQAIANLNPRDLVGIGFAMPGPFDYKHGVALFDQNVGKFQSLYGVNVKMELLQKLDFPDSFPIRFLNDASAFAVGEASLESASKFKRIIALTLGTGFGTTFIKDGLPVAGVHGIPKDGFLYHIPFQNSIADDYFSTRWFLNEYIKSTGNTIAGVKELAKQAQNNPVVREYFKTFGINLGSFLLPWIQRFDAECIIMGGNISKSIDLFGIEMKSQFDKAGIDISILPSKLDEDAALLGSAKLCDDNFYSKFKHAK